MNDDNNSGDPTCSLALSGDYIASDGSLYFDPEALGWFRDIPGGEITSLTTPVAYPLSIEVMARHDIIIAKRSPVADGVLDDPALRAVLISRNGVGLDHLDLDACSRAGLMISTTPGSARRATAGAAATLLLSCAHRVIEKDALVRRGDWQHRHQIQGTGLQGKMLGLIGAGNVGQEILALMAPWGMRYAIASPRKTEAEAAAIGAELLPLDELFRQADFLVLACQLSDETRHLVNSRTLALMKPDAILINVARGGVLDEAALFDALSNGRLRSAGLDVFDPEPPSPDNPLFGLDNVVLSPHGMGFSDESNRIGNQLAARNALAVSRGEAPDNLVNPDALEHPRVRAFLTRRKEMMRALGHASD